MKQKENWSPEKKKRGKTSQDIEVQRTSISVNKNSSAYYSPVTFLSTLDEQTTSKHKVEKIVINEESILNLMPQVITASYFHSICLCKSSRFSQLDSL